MSRQAASSLASWEKSIAWSMGRRASGKNGGE